MSAAEADTQTWRFRFRQMTIIVPNPPNATKLKLDGSGTVVISKPQLTTVLCPPAERSAKYNTQVPSGLLPLNELKGVLGEVLSNSDGVDAGSRFRPSGCQVPPFNKPEYPATVW